MNIPCMGSFGGPVNPDIALGGFSGKNYTDAKSMIITFIVKNHKSDDENKKAKAWEKAFLQHLKEYNEREDKNLTVAYTSERSVEDEINRESNSDIITILVSYLLMFVYIAVALGQFNSCKRILVCIIVVFGRLISLPIKLKALEIIYY